MSRAATAPPIADPSDTVMNISMINRVRRRCGEYSPVRAIVLGRTPPSPMPVTNLIMTRSDTLVAWVVASEPSAKTRTPAITSHLRPR